jgi:hypothetical protein
MEASSPFSLSFLDPIPTAAVARIANAVWRTSLDRDGFAVIVPSSPVDSKSLRRFMVDFVTAFGEAIGTPFVPERLGRFDQQVTTKFHRDGAPEASLLVLGYEPSSIQSRFFLADACRAANDAGMGVNAFLSANNPMFPNGERLLGPYVQELLVPRDTGAIVVVNNSLFPDDTPTPHLLGLLHKGTIERPDPHARRVINSMGLTPDVPNAKRLPDGEILRFLNRDDLD